MNHPIEFGHIVSYQICYDMNHPILIRPLIAIIKMNFCGLTELYFIVASDKMLHSDFLSPMVTLLVMNKGHNNNETSWPFGIMN